MHTLLHGQCCWCTNVQLHSRRLAYGHRHVNARLGICRQIPASWDCHNGYHASITPLSGVYVAGLGPAYAACCWPELAKGAAMNRCNWNAAKCAVSVPGSRVRIAACSYKLITSNHYMACMQQMSVHMLIQCKVVKWTVTYLDCLKLNTVCRLQQLTPASLHSIARYLMAHSYTNSHQEPRCTQQPWL